MSATQVKNARRIWDAFQSLTLGEWGTRRAWVRVSDVAKKCGMSKPTVKKYLEMATEQGFARKWVPASGIVFYAPDLGD